MDLEIWLIKVEEKKNIWMSYNKNHRHFPNPEQVISLMCGAPVSKTLTKGSQYKYKKGQVSTKEVADLLGTSAYHVAKIIKAW